MLSKRVLIWAGGISVVLLLIKLVFDQLHDPPTGPYAPLSQGEGPPSTGHSNSGTGHTTRDGASRQSATSSPGEGSFEVISLPFGKQGHTVYAEVLEDEVAESVASTDSWQVLSEAESGAPAAPGDPKNLVAQMALMLERKAQIQSGNPAVIHPATFTYRKVENWADTGDDREAQFDPAIRNPVFYGAEWSHVGAHFAPIRGDGGRRTPVENRAWFGFGS